MKKFLRLATLIAVSGFLITCDKNDEITPRPYPTVLTHAVVNTTSEGTTLQGEIVSMPDEVIDHGFEVSLYYNFAPSVTKKISLDAATQKGVFETFYDKDMKAGVTYYVRAYARSQTHFVLGNMITFTSLGSKAPVITSVVPSTATWGDQVIIIGSGFKSFQGNSSLKFNDTQAIILEVKNDSIVCIVPDELNTSPVSVSVTLLGNTSIVENAFELEKPVITSVTPSSARVGTLISVTGKYFSPTHYSVAIGGRYGTVQNVTTTSMECKVPVALTPGPTTIVLKTGTGLSTEVSFEVIP